jgi:hypothetical protein
VDGDATVDDRAHGEAEGILDQTLVDRPHQYAWVPG